MLYNFVEKFEWYRCGVGGGVKPHDVKIISKHWVRRRRNEGVLCISSIDEEWWGSLSCIMIILRCTMYIPTDGKKCSIAGSLPYTTTKDKKCGHLSPAIATPVRRNCLFYATTADGCAARAANHKKIQRCYVPTVMASTISKTIDWWCMMSDKKQNLISAGFEPAPTKIAA